MSKDMRNSSIELLRIIAVLGVVILHFNGVYGNAFEYVETGAINDIALRYLESLFVPAVNLFVLISGYYMCSTYKRPVVKPIYLIIQVMVFGGICYLLSVVENGMGSFSYTSAARSVIPSNYYVILYATLYLVSPFINVALHHINEKQLKRFVVIFVLLFSVCPILIDVLQEILSIEFQGLNPIGLLGDQNGYTIVNFILMYIIGAYIRITDIKWSVKKALFIMGVCSALLTVWSLVLPSTAWSYCNPLVIVEAVAAFLLFKELSIKSLIINKASKAVFTCYLFHSYVVQHLPVKYIVQQNTLYMIALLLVSVIGTYLVCWCMYGIYSMIEKNILKRILKRLNTVIVDIEQSDRGQVCK